jgi:curved DNA-binding protein CbpA
MLRLAQLRLAARRCHYEVLGVGPNATLQDVKGAFRDKAKAMHPDTAGGADGKTDPAFAEMVEAYRILRDDRRRAEYDRGRSFGRTRHGSNRPKGPTGDSQWPRGDGNAWEGTGRARSNAPPADATFYPAGLKAERAAVGSVLLAGVLFLIARPSFGSDREQDPHPARRPRNGSVSIVSEPGTSPAAAANAKQDSSTTGSRGDSSTTKRPSAASLEAQAEVAAAEQTVRAYWNPFWERWQRIPKGYEAPASMDLTAWHKKRTDPVEWSRLFAEGKLAEIIPRGGLKERFIPAWNAYEPVLVMDPLTNKTIQVTTTLPDRVSTPQCEVQF